MGEYTQLPDKPETSTIVVKVILTHDAANQDDEAYIWSDPAVDIVREVRKALLKHSHIRDVNVQIYGDVDEFSANFIDL